MAVEQCDTVFHRIKIGGRSYDIKSWQVRCDTCKAVATKIGDDPGEAHERAWKEGFRPVNAGILRPMIWVCEACGKRAAAKRQAV